MTTLNIYKTYSFKTKDPVIDQLRTLTKKSKANPHAIAIKAGLSPNTPRNWFDGATRRPQSASVEAYGRALGYRRDWVRIEMKKEEK